MSYLTLSSVVYADDLCYILFTEVELSCVGEVSIATPTQLNSTRRRVTQLDVELSTRSQRQQLSPINERTDPVDSVCRSWRYKKKHD